MTPQEVANKITVLSGIDPFYNTREPRVIEVRSLLCFLLREKLEMRWIAIKQFFKKNGRKTDNASLINSYKKYNLYKRNNKSLNKWEAKFTFENENIDQINQVYVLQNRCRTLERKIKNCEEKNKENIRNLINSRR